MFKDVCEHAALYCIATVSVELCCLSRASFLFVRETVSPTIIKTTRLSVSDRNGVVEVGVHGAGAARAADLNWKL